MSMDTNLQGRLRNTSLLLNHGLAPLFEAVVNSIHAIEDAGLSTEDGKIIVEIIRDTQGELMVNDKVSKKETNQVKEITGFKVTDNGIGFTDDNTKSFRTLDSDYKKERGGRGVGRLLWLKAFKRVRVESTFKDGNAVKSRTFFFNADSGLNQERVMEATSSTGLSTTVYLNDFSKRYQESVPKTAIPIASRLFEHCLWYFVREGSSPTIIIQDDNESINLNDVFEQHMIASAKTEDIIIKGEKFELIHVKLRSNSTNSHVMALCAASRLVTEENLSGKIAGLFGRLSDEEGNFFYACYVSSAFLDEAVRSERTEFSIAEDPGELFAKTELSLGDIRDTVKGRVAAYLAKYLDSNKAKAKERVESFVNQKAPRYRPILKRIPEDKLMLDPAISDKDLDITLHRYLAEIEESILSTGHDLMEPKEGETSQDYEKRLKDYLSTVHDIKKSDLANYVSHRRVILDLLEKAIRRDSNGSYAYEEHIHKFILPMRVESNDIEPDGSNLWLIDERLAFHDYLASDKTLSSMPITESFETKEPDILALNVFDNPILVSEGDKLPLASIVVIEIKRPMRDDSSSGEEKDPIEQALGYVNNVREGKIKTHSGRQIPNSSNIPAFCYIICDITPSIKKRCQLFGFTPTQDYLGYFGYNPNFKAYVEVISFDRLVMGAKERNRAFFDKLGLPTR